MRKPLLTNERAKKEWAWILERVGPQAAQEALETLQGAQRPYPLNVARKLGLKLPEHLSEPPAPRSVAHTHLAALKASLKSQS